MITKESKTQSTASNVDDNEVRKFDVSSWWQADGEFHTLHAINPIRMSFIERHVQLSQKKVIDIGCGGGILTEALAKAGALVTGIDMSQQAIASAKEHAVSQSLKIEYIETTAEELTKKTTGKFDVVTCMELLEHVPDPASLVHACSELVKKNGWVFFSTINRNFKAFLFAIVGAEYLLNMLPRGTHDYQKFIQPAELLSWGRQYHLTCEAIAGMHYDPFGKKFSLSPKSDINYLVALKKI